jgi:hypothetical protein
MPPRWLLIVLWIAALFVWSLAFAPSKHPEFGFGYHSREALCQMTTPAKLLVLVVGTVVIWKQPWKRKPLAER